MRLILFPLRVVSGIIFLVPLTVILVVAGTYEAMFGRKPTEREIAIQNANARDAKELYPPFGPF